MHIQDEQKNGLYENTYKNPQHFSFGKNWQNFLTTLNQERIEEAEKSLTVFLGGKANIAGKTFVDIGCGSGLFSLAAYRLGARKVISVDVDDFSLACATLLRKRQKNPKNWRIHKGSVLNTEFLNSLGTYDLVESWGVLHHTGDMYRALKNVSTLANPGGEIYLAIYNDNQIILEGTSTFWLKIKKIYNKSPWIIKKAIQILYTIYYVLGLLAHKKNPIHYIKHYTSLRGMNFFTDIKDWLGGYPYEFSSAETIISYFEKRGFRCSKTTKARSIGCNEFLFTQYL